MSEKEWFKKYGWAAYQLMYQQVGTTDMTHNLRSICEFPPALTCPHGKTPDQPCEECFKDVPASEEKHRMERMVIPPIIIRDPKGRAMTTVHDPMTAQTILYALNKAKELEVELKAIKQAHWDARAKWGFDNDGDPTPVALTFPTFDHLITDDWNEVIERQKQLQSSHNEAVKAAECHASEVKHLQDQLTEAHKLLCGDFHSKFCASLTKDHWGSADVPCNCKPDKYKIKLLPERENLSSGGFTAAILDAKTKGQE
jgi:hypothetical protein